VNVPVQYYQSVIAIETAVTGVLLFQIRFFDPDADAPGKSATDPRVRVLMLIVLTATLFGSLEAIREGGGLEVAVLVTVGLAVSILPALDIPFENWTSSSSKESATEFEKQQQLVS